MNNLINKILHISDDSGYSFSKILLTFIIWFVISVYCILLTPTLILHIKFSKIDKNYLQGSSLNKISSICLSSHTKVSTNQLFDTTLYFTQAHKYPKK